MAKQRRLDRYFSPSQLEAERRALASYIYDAEVILFALDTNSSVERELLVARRLKKLHRKYRNETPSPE